MENSDGVMTTDAGHIHGLKLAILGDHTCAKLKKSFPCVVSWIFNSDSDHTDASQEKTQSLQQLYIQWLLSNKKITGKPFALWCFSAGRREMELIEKIETHQIPVRYPVFYC